MSRHLQADVSGDTSSFKRSDNSEPSGVAQERMDPYTLEIVQRLFPRGIQFLALLLRYALVKQFALPGWPEAVDAAMIQVQSLRVLAKRIGWSYDTVEKYVIVFCALGLLYKERSRTAITLYFPLGRYTPPASLDLLDEIEQDYRPKAQQFAKRVRRRFVATFSALPVSPAPADASAGVPAPFDLPGTLLDIERTLREEGVQLAPQQQQRIRIKITGVLRSRCTQAVLPAESRLSSEETDDSLWLESPASEGTGNSWPTSLPQKGRLSQQKEDFVATKTIRNGRLPRKTGDSSFVHHDKESTFLEQKGDFAHKVADRESTLSSEKVDSDRHQMPRKGRLSSQTGDSSARIGDSETYEEALNVNVISKIHLLNVNVRQVAIYLCHLFKEVPKNKAGFYTHLYDKLECRDTDLWLAALIETAQSLSRQKTEMPGRYFYSRCVELHQNGIPPRTLQLVQRVQQDGTLTYQQLLETLQQPPVTRLMPSSPAGQSNRPRSSAEKIIKHIPRPPKELPGMAANTYLTFAKQLKERVNTRNMRSAPYQQNDGTVLALVEDWVGHQRWICSLEDWQRCAPTIQRSMWPSETKKTSCGTYHGGSGN